MDKNSPNTNRSSSPSNDVPEISDSPQIPSNPHKPFVRRVFTSIPAYIILGLVVLYFVATLLILPFGGRSFLEKKLTETFQAPCVVTSIRCNPFTLEIRATDIVIPYPGNKGTFLAVEAIRLQPQVWQTISTLTPNLGSLHITTPRVSLGVFKDGLFSLNTYPFTQKQTDQNSEPGGTFPFVINDIELTNGSISLWDMRHDLTQDINDIYIRIPFASSLPKDKDIPVAPEARAVINGSPITLGANAILFSDHINTELNIDLGRIPIEHFRAYLAPYTNLNLEKAALSAILSFRAGQLDANKGFDISIKGKINIFDVNLVDPNAKKNVLTLGRGELEIERFLLHPQDISINSLTLDQIQLFAHRLPDGSINWMHYFKKTSQPAAVAKTTVTDQTATSANKTTLPPFILKKMTVAHTQIEWQDDAIPNGMKHTFKDLSASLSGLDTRGTKDAHVQLSLKDEAFGDLKVNGQYSLNANTLTLNADVTDFKIASLEAYLKAVPIIFEQGAVSAQIAATLNLQESMPLDSLTGSATVAGLTVTDSKLWRLQTKEIQASNFRFTGSPMEFEADSLTIDTPQGNFTLLPSERDKAAHAQLEQISQETKEIKRKEATQELDESLQTTEDTMQENIPTQKGGTSPLASVDEKLSIFKTFKIAKVLVKNGAFNFKDQRVSPAATGRISNLAITLDNLTREPNSMAQLSISGLFDKAPFRAHGTLNPLKAPLNAAVRVEIDALNMVRLSPFAMQALAYPIKSGIFSADLDIAFKNDVLHSTNHFILKNFNLGSKVSTPGAPDLPLPLAVALLKGPSGVIDLTVDANGRLDDPQFSVAGIVVKIIGNILVKALTSPFTLVAGIFSSDDDAATPNLRYMRFSPGSADLSKRVTTNIAAITSLLNKRPNLRLELTGMADTKDRSGLVDQYILEKMQTIKYNNLTSAARATTSPKTMTISREANPEEYAELLHEVYSDSSFPIPRNIFGIAKKQPIDVMLAAFHKNITPTEEELQKLAITRAEAIKKAILAADPKLIDRISVNPNPVLEKDDHDKRNMAAVRLDLTVAE